MCPELFRNLKTKQDSYHLRIYGRDHVMCDVVLAPVEICVGKTSELGSPPLTGDQVKVFIEKVALCCDVISSNYKNISPGLPWSSG